MDQLEEDKDEVVIVHMVMVLDYHTKMDDYNHRVSWIEEV
jgi:hypothetical protein